MIGIETYSIRSGYTKMGSWANQRVHPSPRALTWPGRTRKEAFVRTVLGSDRPVRSLQDPSPPGSLCHRCHNMGVNVSCPTTVSPDNKPRVDEVYPLHDFMKTFSRHPGRRRPRNGAPISKVFQRRKTILRRGNGGCKGSSLKFTAPSDKLLKATQHDIIAQSKNNYHSFG